MQTEILSTPGNPAENRAACQIPTGPAASPAPLCDKTKPISSTRLYLAENSGACASSANSLAATSPPSTKTKPSGPVASPAPFRDKSKPINSKEPTMQIEIPCTPGNSAANPDAYPSPTGQAVNPAPPCDERKPIGSTLLNLPEKTAIGPSSANTPPPSDRTNPITPEAPTMQTDPTENPTIHLAHSTGQAANPAPPCHERKPIGPSLLYLPENPATGASSANSPASAPPPASRTNPIGAMHPTPIPPTLLYPAENPAALAALASELDAIYTPSTIEESEFVQQILIASWLRARYEKVRDNLYDAKHVLEQNEANSPRVLPLMESIQRFQREISRQKKVISACRRGLRKLRGGEECLLDELAPAA